MAILEVAQLEKSFGGTKVLRDISFSLEEGQRPHRRPGTESAGREPVPSGAAAEPAALRAGVSGF